LGTVQDNAYHALENLESEYEKVIPEDYLFLEIEYRIHGSPDRRANFDKDGFVRCRHSEEIEIH